MEKWYSKHPGILFFIGITASVVTYAYTNFSTKAEVSSQIASVKEPLTEVLHSIDKRLERIEDAVYKTKE
jgi:hypothetical protein